MRIAILGGSFDPPHKGHIVIAKQILKQFLLDEVWLMPCYSHPFNKRLSAPIHRLSMTKYLEEKNIKASDFEIQQKKTSFTIDTLRNLSKQFPSYTFYWLIGSDQLPSFPKWKNWQEIIQNYHLIVFPRETETKNLREEVKMFLSLEDIPTNIIAVDSDLLKKTDTSSTQIRKFVKEKKSIDELVPKDIKNYIVAHKLYIN